MVQSLVLFGGLVMNLGGPNARKNRCWKVRQVAALTLLLAGSNLVVARSEPYVVPFRMHQGLPCVPCSTNRGNYDCVLDTGAAATVIDERSVAATVWLGAQQVDGLDGSHTMRLLETSITVGGVPLKVVAHVTNLRSTIGADVIIGEDVLRQFRSVTIDYKSKTALFDYGE